MLPSRCGPGVLEGHFDQRLGASRRYLRLSAPSERPFWPGDGRLPTRETPVHSRQCAEAACGSSHRNEQVGALGWGRLARDASESSRHVRHVWLSTRWRASPERNAVVPKAPGARASGPVSRSLASLKRAVGDAVRPAQQDSRMRPASELPRSGPIGPLIVAVTVAVALRTAQLSDRAAGRHAAAGTC